MNLSLSSQKLAVILVAASAAFVAYAQAKLPADVDPQSRAATGVTQSRSTIFGGFVLARFKSRRAAGLLRRTEDDRPAGAARNEMQCRLYRALPTL
jgi:hypothetical protein